MALSMEEERILTEIASRLSQDDPALARRLTRFSRQRRRHPIRLIAVLIAVTVAAMIGIGVAVVIAVT